MNTYIRGTLLALLAAVPGLALAVNEQEDNHPVASAQMLDIGDITVDGVATTGAIVDGVIGVRSGTKAADLDYYTFTGKAGDVVTVDIDGGVINATKGKEQGVDTILALFGPAPTYVMLMTKDDVTKDPGSVGNTTGTQTRDAQIVNFRLLADGTYTIGVSAFPRRFASGGGTTSSTIDPIWGNGGYTLIVSGVTPSVMQISIEVKPGSGEVAPINPKAKGKVPVALLGSDEFSVDDVDTSTLRFGRSGTEASLSKCGTPGDVNGDAFPDLVCHFENQAAQFVATDEEGILRGKLDGGRKFEGRGWLKVVPVKADD